MAQFYHQALLLLALLTIISESGDIPPVIASQEDDVALPCVDSKTFESMSSSRLKWKKWDTKSSQSKIILVRPKTPDIQDAGRAKWKVDGNEQMSLFLTKLQKSDEGLYSCEIWQGWDLVLLKNISLIVKECKVLQSVKPAPGMPVNLTCPVNVTSQQGPWNISWVKVKGGKPTSVGSSRVKINGTSLVFQSVNNDDHGWYSCRYIHGQTERCFEINLQVQGNAAVETTTVQAQTTMRPLTRKIILASNEEKSGWPYTVAAPVTVVMVIIAAMTGLFIYYRRKAQSDARQAQRRAAGNMVFSLDEYENVHISAPEDSAQLQDNSLYQQCKDGSLQTFY